MKRVWTGPSIVDCDFQRAMLETSGIPCVVNNLESARWTGIGYPVPSGQALLYSWPEIWVQDEDEARAVEVIHRP